MGDVEVVLAGGSLSSSTGTAIGQARVSYLQGESAYLQTSADLVR